MHHKAHLNKLITNDIFQSLIQSGPHGFIQAGCHFLCCTAGKNKLEPHASQIEPLLATSMTRADDCRQQKFHKHDSAEHGSNHTSTCPVYCMKTLHESNQQNPTAMLSDQQHILRIEQGQLVQTGTACTAAYAVFADEVASHRQHVKA